MTLGEFRTQTLGLPDTLELAIVAVGTRTVPIDLAVPMKIHRYLNNETWVAHTDEVPKGAVLGDQLLLRVQKW